MPRELSEAHKRKMQAGRQKKAKARRAGAAERVRKFREWNAADSAAALALREGRITAEERVIVLRKIKDIEIPSDADYRAVRGEE